MEKISLGKIILVSAVIIGGLFIGLSYLSENEMKATWLNSKFTVATMTSNWHHKNSNGVGTDFTYSVGGRTISKTTNFNLKKGTRYLVMYDSLSPSWYIMLGRHQLPDSIEAPPNGWKFKEIPITIDSAELKQYFKELGMD